MSSSCQDKKDNWKSTQKRVLDFSTAEEFWRVINNVSSPSRLSYADYSVFRSGVTPMWEDPVCAKGGRWILAVDRFMRRDARSSGQEEVMMILRVFVNTRPACRSGWISIQSLICEVVLGRVFL